MEKAVRNSGHEILRLIAMYMIVCIHANMYLGNFCSGDTQRFFNGVVNGICNIGVSCFILISGYYGVRFSIGKFLKMECMMITYSLLETAILCMVFPEQMQGAVLLEQLLKSVFPFITRKYWFYSCYVCLFFLSGYIQRFLDGLKKKEFRNLLVLLVVLFSVLPTACYFELVPDNGKGLVQMLMVYMIGRYIRMHADISLPKKKAIPLFFILWIINGTSHEFPLRIGGIYHHLCKDNSITNLIMAVILFYCFKELTFRSKAINKAASYIFAVFALNNTLVNVVMSYLEKNNMTGDKGVVGFLLLLAINLTMLLVCLGVGMLRDAIFGFGDRKICDAGEKMAKKVINRISEK